VGRAVFKADNDMREMPSRRTSLRAVAVATALALILVLPAAASADPVAKGRTHLELSRKLLTALKGDDVRLSKLGQGKAQGRVVSLPVSGGLVDLGSGSGSVDHEGGFKFSRGGRVVKLTGLTLDTAKRGLWGKVDGQRMKIASFAGFGVERAGFGDEIGIEALKLQAGAASLLDSKLQMRGVFAAAHPFAALSSSFQPEYDTVAAGSLQFTLDAGTVAKLRSLGVEPMPFEVASGPTPFSYSAPILFGSIYPDLKGGGGTIEGGIEIAVPNAPGPVITIYHLGLSLESNKAPADFLVHTESGQLAPAPAGPLGALDLSGATARVDPGTRAVTITNAQATLEAPAANLINETFAKPKGKPPAVAAGDPLGTFSLTMTGR
jgi:hypothetical protein